MKKSIIALSALTVFIAPVFGEEVVYGTGGKIITAITTEYCPDPDVNICARLSVAPEDLQAGIQVVVRGIGNPESEVLIIDQVGELERNGTLQGANITFRNP